jgi:hypothetical protein
VDEATATELARELALEPPLPHRPRRRPRWPGRTSLALGVLTPLLAAIGIAAATSDAYLVATVLAIGALVASALAVVVGTIAIVGRWARGAGIAAVALGVVGNPVVLLSGLTLLGGRA